MSPPPQLFNWEDLGAGPEVAPQCFKRVLSENGKWGGRRGRQGAGGALCSQRAQPGEVELPSEVRGQPV